MANPRKTGRIGQRNYPALLQMIQSGQTAGQISTTLGVDAETVRKFARKRGLTIVPHDQAGENHPSWTGGYTKDRQGYLLQRVEVDGPYGYLIRALRKGDKRGYAPVHRIRMHDKLGRPLVEGEVVHHKDDDISNNETDNLFLYSDNATHLRETLAGKVPNWTEEGFANMCKPRPYRQRSGSQPEPTPDHSKTDDPA